MFWFLIFWEEKKIKYHHQCASPVLGMFKGFVSLAATGYLEYTVLSPFSVLGLAHLSVSADRRKGGQIHWFLDGFFSVSCSSKMFVYELVILGNLCKIIWEANGSLSILWNEWELFPSLEGVPDCSDYSEWRNLSVCPPLHAYCAAFHF